MIKGQPYTRAADIWSAGVLLYSMVSGKLPYEDDQVQRLLQKIVYTDVHYPPAMSPTLVDLLKKMLVKSPEQRITLDKIKAHPWFSQTEYATLIQDYFGQSIFSDNIVEGSIDKEIVDKMTNLGIDCRKLHQQILINEYTEITAIYRMLANDKLKEKMRALMDLFQKQDNKKKHTNNSQFAIMNRNVHAQPQATNGNVNPGFNLNFNKIQNLPIQTIYQGNTNCIHPCFNCTLSSRTKIPNSQNNNVNNNNNVKGPRKLMVPAPVKIAERRLSRPVAVNRMVDFLDKSNAYESP
ncbi:hypothetical protein TRFO_40422 [Tritrichomonas foetus]|uniref:Protein kinase domain-containing protein n=1 Tax=Tritrichomonas foetus TaxID=1144522 RepID=A0A1J4J1G7_9EUKA|nr:hypothetical protein TRFO_40422 [Tritrichomonas foetus]|eukprot:OHS93266.1 hypothetical protein TRFO_40422 [Tritrichomonas foetus]